MRAGEVLETVPGMIISQHSGEGKANQYYVRGFNLDHGTDFSTTVAGHRIAVQVSGDGWLALTVRRDGPTVESVSWNESGELIEVRGIPES